MNKHITENWVKNVIGKNRMKMVEELDVYDASGDYGQCVDIMMLDGYEDNIGRTISVSYTNDPFGKTLKELKTELRDKLDLFQKEVANGKQT